MKTPRVFIRAEDADFSVLATESLKALKARIAIVEHSGKGVETEIEIISKFRFRPLSVSETTIDNGICFSVTEAKASPIKIFHIQKLFIILYQFSHLVAHFGGAKRTRTGLGKIFSDKAFVDAFADRFADGGTFLLQSERIFKHHRC